MEASSLDEALPSITKRSAVRSWDRGGESNIDLTLSTKNLGVARWTVNDRASSSDHRLITCRVSGAEQSAARNRRTKLVRFRDRRIDWDTFEKYNPIQDWPHSVGASDVVTETERMFGWAIAESGNVSPWGLAYRAASGRCLAPAQRGQRPSRWPGSYTCDTRAISGVLRAPTLHRPGMPFARDCSASVSGQQNIALRLIAGAGWYVRNDVIARDLGVETIGEFVRRLTKRAFKPRRRRPTHRTTWHLLDRPIRDTSSQGTCNEKQLHSVIATPAALTQHTRPHNEKPRKREERIEIGSKTQIEIEVDDPLYQSVCRFARGPSDHLNRSRWEREGRRAYWTPFGEQGLIVELQLKAGQGAKAINGPEPELKEGPEPKLRTGLRFKIIVKMGQNLKLDRDVSCFEYCTKVLSVLPRQLTGGGAPDSGGPQNRVGHGAGSCAKIINNRVNMDQDADEMRYGKGLVNQNWLVKNEEEKLPPLELVRSSFFTSTKNDSETAKHSDRKQEFDKAVNLYTTRKTDIVAKHHLPFSPPPERKKHTYSKNDRDANDIPSLKVSLKPDLRILASEPNQSVGSNTTVTITEEDEKMLHFLKSKGLTLEDIRKITDEIEDDKKYTALSSEKDKTEYSDMEREYFEKIREALLQSKGVRKKELLSFLFYLSLDNHDCVKSLLCRSEMNEDVSQPLASSLADAYSRR
ncbi:hypothetical protein EVAR_38041_1 [Eumeta japonica]|uniref:Uncharacterized protein n=1 Tax=Eumeta variegata TaxID=151549 RepID=A0A4C1WAV3_EUMVA|nr:hypothetical protein EVAR_38041_1 [Eumeta japonica]